MLSAAKILEFLRPDVPENSGGISIVPRPDVNAIKGRGAASVDLRLGRWFQSIRQSRQTSLLTVLDPQGDVDTVATKRHFVPFGERFILHPGRFVLGGTIEWLRLSSRIAAHVTGKSSLGRRGLIIETAAGIHPGFSGCLTLELANVGEVPIELRPGMLVCQIFFHELNGEATEAPGQFSGNRRPSLGRVPADPVLSRLSSK